MAEEAPSSGRDVIIWTGDDQPWPQYGDNPTRNFSIPDHSPDGGFGQQQLGSITDPVINWRTYAADDYGVQSYGVAIADFSNQISGSVSALERCGQGNLFAVFTAERASDTSNDWLVIVEAGLDKEAWRVDLGNTEDVKSTPAIVDVDGDGKVEVILAFDTSSGLTVEAWSPRLSCSDAGWQADGHTTELLWSYTDPDQQLGIGGGFANGNHEATTQALIADLQMDGIPELVLATVDSATGNPTVLTLPLGAAAPSEPLWEIQLDFGTHPSDPTWVALDETTSAVLLTTIDEDDGSMWAWKLQGATGSPDWNARSLVAEGASGVPHIRLPGPVIAQLDADSLPEVIFTAPGDWDGSGVVDAASFHAWELTDGTEKWSFMATNGYADAPPTAIDADGDGVVDRVCWITWWEDGIVNQDRHGRIGCHDVTSTNPEVIWAWDVEPSGSSPNEGVALGAPLALDIDGIGAPEIVIAYGEMLRAFDGDDGHNDVWSAPLDLERRTWAQPSAADLDGDGMLDLLIGDILVSQANVDIAPLLDQRGITFSPSVADPGETVVITAQYTNQGTVSTEGEPVDAVLYVDNAEVGRHRVSEMLPGSPTGSASDAAFSVDWVATLGTHQVRLELDPNSNLTQSRVDNDIETVAFTVVEPYDLAITLPPDPFLIEPGSQLDLDIDIQAVGRRSGEWSLSLDEGGMPENWTITETTPAAHQGVTLDPSSTPWSPSLRAAVPQSAQGSETGTFLLTMTLDADPTVSITALVPIEVNRTRGLSLIGPDGSAHSTGQGIEEEFATAWFQIVNLGNAEERLTSMTWSSNDWGEEPQIHDEDGGPYFTLTLAPGERRELYAKVTVPNATLLGDVASSDLTACIGTGDDFQCQQIAFDFIANSLSVMPPHFRTLPGVDLSYELQADSSAGEIVLDLAAADMLQPGWSWTFEGQGSFDGTLLSIPQQADISLVWMNVTIDSQSPPQLHLMQTSPTGQTSLNLSAQILQRHDATIEVVDPSVQPLVVDVEQWSTFVVRAVNKGNAEDSFELSARFVPGGDITVDPGVEFSIAQPSFDVAVDASVLPTIDFRLPVGTAAGEELLLQVVLRSLLEPALTRAVELRVSAKQDHNWSMDAPEVDLIEATPGESITFSFNATNTGNLEDALSWQSSLELERTGSDASSWNFDIDEAQTQQVGELVVVEITTTVPTNAWADTVAYYNLSAISDGLSVADLAFRLVVGRISGWTLDLSGSSLDVSVAGSNISISVQNEGNAIVAPILIPVMPSGWGGTNSTLLTQIDPGASSSTTISVMPPEDGLAGEVGMLTLIIKDGDTLAGRSVIEVPLRIASLHRTEVGSDSGYGADWILTPQGGMPLAWITNTGNALSEIEIAITPPAGWTAEHPDSFYLAAGATRGLPINLIPAADWDYANFTQDVMLTDPTGTIHLLSLDVHSLVGNQNLSWATSPVLVGVRGDAIPVMLFGESGSFNSTITLSESGIGSHPPCDDGDSSDCGDDVVYRAFVSEPAVLDGTCSIEEATLAAIEASGVASEDVAASCLLAASEEQIHWSISLRVDGRLVSSSSGSHQGNVSLQNLTLEAWSGSTGVHTLVIDLYDSQGRLVDSATTTMVIRATGWNIGISSVDESSDGSELTVNMRRANYEQLADVHCVLSAVSGEWTMDWRVYMASGTLAPTLSFARPDIEDGANIAFTLGCEQPYDADDDSTDDTFTHNMNLRETIPMEALDWIWGVGAALLVLGIARLLGFLQISPRSTPRRGRPESGGAAASPSRRVSDPSSPEDGAEVDADEDIHLDVGEGVEESEADDEADDQTDEEEMDEIDEVVEVFDVGEEIIQEEAADEPPAEQAFGDDIDSKIERMMSRERFRN